MYREDYNGVSTTNAWVKLWSVSATDDEIGSALRLLIDEGKTPSPIIGRRADPISSSVAAVFMGM